MDLYFETDVRAVAPHLVVVTFDDSTGELGSDVDRWEVALTANAAAVLRRQLQEVWIKPVHRVEEGVVGREGDQRAMRTYYEQMREAALRDPEVREAYDRTRAEISAEEDVLLRGLDVHLNMDR